MRKDSLDGHEKNAGGTGMNFLRSMGQRGVKGPRNSGRQLNSGLLQKTRWKKENSPRTVTRLLVIGVFLAIVIGLTFTTVRQSLAFLADNPLYAIKTLDIAPPSYVSAAEIGALSGVSKGDNLLRLSLSEVRKRLLDHPNIKDALVQRLLPDVLRIEIKERVPVAQITIDKNYLVDGEGAVLTWNDKFAKMDLPLLEGVDLKSKVVDNKIQSETLCEVLSILQLFRSSVLMTRMDISKVKMDDAAGYLFLTNTQLGLRMSPGLRSAEIQEKFLQLSGVLEDLKKRGVVAETIDLRFKDIVVSPCSESAHAAVAAKQTVPGAAKKTTEAKQ